MALSDNLVSYWKLDESSGNAADSVGSYTATNASSVGFTTGKINNCATLSAASTDYFTTTLTPTANGSINFWIKTTSTTYPQEIIGSDTANENHRILLNTGGKINFQIYTGGVEKLSISSTTSVNTGDWFMVTCVWGSGGAKIYINGNSTPEATSADTSYGAGSQGWYLGVNNNNGGTKVWYLTADLDEVGIWSRAITTEEETELYNSGNGIQYPFGVEYTMTITTGSYVYTGFNFLFKIALKMAITTGSYTYTGINFLLKLGKGMIITTGSYAYTGVNFTLKSARTMAITTGSYIYTGVNFLFERGYKIIIDTVSYIYTGINFILRSSNIWTNQTKNTSTFTNQTKNNSDWTNQTKS